MAEFVVTADASMEDVITQLRDTTAHIVVVVSAEQAALLAAGGGIKPTARAQQLAEAVGTAVKEAQQLCAKTLACVVIFPGCFLLWREEHVRGMTVKKTIFEPGVTYACAEFNLREDDRNADAAVAVGVVCNHIHPDEGSQFPEDFLREVSNSIADHKVSFLTGVFGDTREQMEWLCTQAGAMGKCAVCQPWALPSAVAEAMPMCGEFPDAVAEKWGLNPDEPCMHYSYPTYFFIFGHCRDGCK